MQMYIFISNLQINFSIFIFKIFIPHHHYYVHHLNYLAHAFLSLNDIDIQIGNLIGDFVKGNKFQLYPEKIKQGILLHRRIDHFTDQHELVREAIAYFKPSIRLSGGIFVDILFDHFLANDERYFTEDQLGTFTIGVYDNLKQNELIFDDMMKQLFSHMTNNNWLYNYRQQEGLNRSIRGMCKRFPIIGNPDKALSIIDARYDELKAIYTSYFPILNQHVNAMNS